MLKRLLGHVLITQRQPSCSPSSCWAGAQDQRDFWSSMTEQSSVEPKTVANWADKQRLSGPVRPHTGWTGWHRHLIVKLVSQGIWTQQPTSASTWTMHHARSATRPEELFTAGAMNAQRCRQTSSPFARALPRSYGRGGGAPSRVPRLTAQQASKRHSQRDTLHRRVFLWTRDASTSWLGTGVTNIKGWPISSAYGPVQEVFSTAEPRVTARLTRWPWQHPLLPTPSLCTSTALARCGHTGHPRKKTLGAGDERAHHSCWKSKHPGAVLPKTSEVFCFTGDRLLSVEARSMNDKEENVHTSGSGFWPPSWTSRLSRARAVEAQDSREHQSKGG